MLTDVVTASKTDVVTALKTDVVVTASKTDVVKSFKTHENWFLWPFFLYSQALYRRGFPPL